MPCRRNEEEPTFGLFFFAFAMIGPGSEHRTCCSCYAAPRLRLGGLTAGAIIGGAMAQPRPYYAPTYAPAPI